MNSALRVGSRFCSLHACMTHVHSCGGSCFFGLLIFWIRDGIDEAQQATSLQGGRPRRIWHVERSSLQWLTPAKKLDLRENKGLVGGGVHLQDARLVSRSHAFTDFMPESRM